MSSSGGDGDDGKSGGEVWLPKPTYGSDLLSSHADLLRKPIVLCQPEPWEAVKHLFPDDAQVHNVTTMGVKEVEAVTAGFDPDGVTAVVGLGGGSALDHAKYTSNHFKLPLLLVPSILSVDAAYTRACGVRDESGSVVYVGDARPVALLVDYSLIRSAPPALNIAGVGDILSCFTALWDWKEAGRLGLETVDTSIAASTEALLGELMAGAEDIAAVSDAGLKRLSDAFVTEVYLCEQYGNARPEEGSEHYLAYHIERQTKKGFLHGRLVSLCVIITGRVQGQDTAPVVDFLSRCGLDWSMAANGLTREEVKAALTSVGEFVKTQPQLLPGVWHWKGSLSAADADEMLDWVEAQPTSPSK